MLAFEKIPRESLMSLRTRMIAMSVIWTAFGGYTWYLCAKSPTRIHYAMLFVAIGMTIANIMRAVFQK